MQQCVLTQAHLHLPSSVTTAGLVWPESNGKLHRNQSGKSHDVLEVRGLQYMFRIYI